MQALILKRLTCMSTHTARHVGSHDSQLGLPYSSQAKMVIVKNTNRLGRHNFYVSFFFALYMFKLKRIFSLCRLHNLYFALLTQFYGNNRTPKQFGVKGFQNSPLFLHYLFLLVFYCALFGTHLTRNSNTPR